MLEGACIGGATMLQPWTLRLTRNAATLAAASPTLLFSGTRREELEPGTSSFTQGAPVSLVPQSVICFRCNSVIHRTLKVIQVYDNGHVGRPYEVSLAPPCPELFCELRGLCRHSYFGPRTCSRSEKPRFLKVCVYYCRTYYKAVRGGEEESGRHVL